MPEKKQESWRRMQDPRGIGVRPIGVGEGAQRRTNYGGDDLPIIDGGIYNGAGNLMGVYHLIEI